MEHPKDVGDVSTAWSCSAFAAHTRIIGVRRSSAGRTTARSTFSPLHCPETAGVCLVPISHLPVRTAASLRVDPTRNNQLDRIHFAADYEVGRVAIEGLRVSSGA